VLLSAAVAALGSTACRAARDERAAASAQPREPEGDADADVDAGERVAVAKDFPLGYQCLFAPLPIPAASIAPGRGNADGRQVIGCHFELRADLPRLDVELHSVAGSPMLERLTLRPADGSWAEQSVRLGIRVGAEASLAIERIDVDEDGTNDLLVPEPCERPECEAVHHLVYRSAERRAGKAAFEHQRLLALTERQDIALGQRCEFFAARRVRGSPQSLPMTDPAWKRRLGRRIVTCHFQLAAALPPFDVELTTMAGIGLLDAVRIAPADGSSPPSRFERLSQGVGLYDWMQLEAVDVDFDRVLDLVMPSGHGTMPCTLYRYFVFDRSKHEAREAAFVSSDVEELCNPRVDPRRKLVIGDDVQQGGQKQLRWRQGQFEVVGAEHP
jgi:hypothetical protein